MRANPDFATDLFTDWYWEQDAELRFTRFEGRRVEFTGHRPTEAIGLRRWELPGTSPLSCTWEAHRAALEARLPFRDFEYSRLQADGRLHYVSASGDPVFDALGRFTGYRGVSSDITQRKRAEEALRLAELNYRSIFDNAVEGMYRVDARGRVVMANLALARMLGYGSPDAMLSGIADVAREVYVDPEDRRRYREELKAHGLIAGFETRWRRTDGTVLWVSISGRMVEDPAGGRYHLGSAVDITERKREERLLALEHSASRLLAEARDEDEAIKAVLEAVARAERWECARYFEVDETAQQMRLRQTWHDGSTAMREFVEGSGTVTFRKGQGLAGHVWETGEVLWVPDVSLDPRVKMRELAARAGMHGALVVPVAFQGEVAGVLSISNRSIREPDARLGRMLAMVCGQLGQFLQRKQAERAIRESEMRFRSLTELSADFYWETDTEHRIARVTHGRQHKILLGGGLIGARRWDVPSTAPGAEGWAVHRAQLDAQQPFRDFEFGRRDGDGIERHISISGEPVFDETGQFAGYRGIGRDITARKRGEQMLNLEHQVTRCLAEAEDVSGALRSVLRAVCETTGWACGRYFHNVIGVFRFQNAWHVPGAEIDRFVAYSAGKAFARGVGIVGRAGAGETIWVANLANDPRVVFKPMTTDHGMRAAFMFPILAEADVIGVLSFTSQEIREPDARLLEAARVIGSQVGQFLQRKQAEEEQRASRQLLDNIVDNIPTAVQLKSVRDGYRIVLWNKAAEVMYGVRREEAIGLTVHDLWPAEAAAAMHAADEDLMRNGGMQDFPDRLALTRHGGSIHVHMRKVALLDADGEPAHMLVIADDVTARLQAEDRRGKHLRCQELLARFGESALGRRDESELVEDAVRTIHEALGGGVAYLQAATEGLCMEAVSLAGMTRDRPAPFPMDATLQSALHRPAMLESPAAVLPKPMADGYACGLLMPAGGEERAHGVLAVLSASATALGPEERKFLEAAASVLSAGMRRIQSEGRLAFLAQFDPLTGLPNRALLADRFSQMIVQANRHGSPLGVLFIDLDHFKHVNDTLGHAGGDALLKETARRLQACVRAGDTVARISGDEFAVLLGDLARAEDAALVAQKILDRLAEPMEVAGKEIFVSASVGIAAFPADGAETETLLHAADAAMYRAKQAGRNAYQFFTPEIEQRTRARAQLGSDLRRALERNEFELAYQPKVDLRTGLPCGAEALLRWRRPDGEVVGPAQFIPVLEETGLIVPVGEWVLRRACADLKAWQAQGLPVLPVAVNVSARQFRQHDLDARVRSLVDAAGLDPALLELEITESQLMHDPEHAVRMVKALHEHGFRIAIDDFGTGYSSLSYLTRFPVSALKIDRSFVAGVLGDPADAAIVRTIIDMAHTLGFRVVGEGVENENQAAFLRGLGCEQAQGYLFARPMPAADFAALIAN